MRTSASISGRQLPTCHMRAQGVKQSDTIVGQRHSCSKTRASLGLTESLELGSVPKRKKTEIFVAGNKKGHIFVSYNKQHNVMGYNSYRTRRFSHRSFYGNYDNFKAALTQSFKDLRRLGYFARQNFECCQSCAWATVPEEKEVGQTRRCLPPGRRRGLQSLLRFHQTVSPSVSEAALLCSRCWERHPCRRRKLAT